MVTYQRNPLGKINITSDWWRVQQGWKLNLQIHVISHSRGSVSSHTGLTAVAQDSILEQDWNKLLQVFNSQRVFLFLIHLFYDGLRGQTNIPLLMMKLLCWRFVTDFWKTTIDNVIQCFEVMLYMNFPDMTCQYPITYSLIMRDNIARI